MHLTKQQFELAIPILVQEDLTQVKCPWSSKAHYYKHTTTSTSGIITNTTTTTTTKETPPRSKMLQNAPHQAAGGGSGGLENPKNLGPQKSGSREHF